MSTFVYYNYQFSKIARQPVQGNLFENTQHSVDPEESFAHKQEILSEILSADYHEKRRIVFKNPKGDKIHLHHYLAPFTSDMAVMKISNRRVRTAETINFEEELREEYPACIVVIDNRPGIQRIVVEKRDQAFSNVKQVQKVLQSTLRHLLRPYGLSISIDQLHTRTAFWKVANDVRQYPLGFRRIRFHLPHLNLERLKKVMGRYLVEARESFDSDLSWILNAEEGGKLNLDENDQRQSALINVLMEDVGGDSVITLHPNGKGQRPVFVGRDNYRLGEMEESTFDKLEEGDPIDREKAMNEIKMFTKRYIE